MPTLKGLNDEKWKFNNVCIWSLVDKDSIMHKIANPIGFGPRIEIVEAGERNRWRDEQNRINTSIDSRHSAVGKTVQNIMDYIHKKHENLENSEHARKTSLQRPTWRRLHVNRDAAAQNKAERERKKDRLEQAKYDTNLSAVMARGAKSLFPLTNLGFCPNRLAKSNEHL